MNNTLRAYLQLTRPPNLLTAISDIWAGIALSGYLLVAEIHVLSIVLLSLSSVFLYAGGVVMNDVCDAKLDAKERPERPIPSGRVTQRAAFRFGMILFGIGIVLAGWVGVMSGFLAFLIALACIIYDYWGKPHPFWGPLTMGLCRGLNLLLGMSIVSISYVDLYWVAVIPVIYIAAITLISRGEVHGGNRSTIWMALFFYVIVVGAIISLAFTWGNLWMTILFLLLFILFIFPPLFKAMKILSGKAIGKSVKAGVLGLILMNACWVAASGAWVWAVATVLLLPLSMWIAKHFAVT